MMGEPVKGTVTSLSSVFAPEEAQKASVRVQETISERQKEVEQLKAFLNDNSSLVNLVKKLPDQLHHDIMVPFGKAAFFPGKLIHTNEFLVLLGEGYYAERTSKQTIEILKRRGKDLESQIETLNAIIKDLKFEASFFDETAIEAAEGIVEIREDYVDEASNEDEARTGEDDYAHILSRIDELEKEELESEMAEEHEEEDKADLSHRLSLTSLEPEEETKNEHLINKIPLQNHTQHEVSKLFKPKESPAFPVSKDSDLSSHIKVSVSSGSNSGPGFVEQHKLKESSPKREASALDSNSSNSKANVVAPVTKEAAFTGSIVEHTHTDTHTHNTEKNAPASKPVSRFKLQRK